MPETLEQTLAPSKPSRLRKLLFWRSLSRRQLLLVSASGVAVILLLALILRPGNTEDHAATAYTVRKSDLVVSVLEGGSLAATNSVEVKCAVEGQSTILTIVPDGYIITEEDVKDGKVLLELDSSKLREQAIQQDISFQDATSAYTQAQEQLEIQKNQNESDISAGKLAVQFARMDLEKFLGAELTAAVLAEKVDLAPLVTGRLSLREAADFLKKLKAGGAASQTWEKLQSDIDLAAATFSNQMTCYEWSRKLGPAIPPDVNLIADADKIIADKSGRKWPDNTVKGDGYIERGKVETDALTLKSNKSSMDQAELALNMFLQYDFPKQEESLSSAYTEALHKLGRTQAQARLSEDRAEVNLKSREAALKIQREHNDSVSKQVAACTIRATKAGMVVYSSSSDPWRRGGQDKIQEGAVVRERQLILAIPDPSAMEVTVRVHEASVDKVKLGQQAKIVVDAFPDITLWGEVKRVARMPDTPNWMSPDLKVYLTTVALKDAPLFLKPGMSAQVEILVNKVENALVAPIQAVFNYNGQRLCYVLDGNDPEPRPVETGQFNDKFIEIAKGLNEGDRVLLHQPPIPDAVLAKLVPKQTPVEAKVETVPPPPDPDAAKPIPAVDRDPNGGPPQAVKPEEGRPVRNRRTGRDRTQGPGAAP